MSETRCTEYVRMHTATSQERDMACHCETAGTGHDDAHTDILTRASPTVCTKWCSTRSAASAGPGGRTPSPSWLSILYRAPRPDDHWPTHFRCHPLPAANAYNQRIRPAPLPGHAPPTSPNLSLHGRRFSRRSAHLPMPRAAHRPVPVPNDVSRPYASQRECPGRCIRICIRVRRACLYRHAYYLAPRRLFERPLRTASPSDPACRA